MSLETGLIVRSSLGKGKVTPSSRPKANRGLSHPDSPDIALATAQNQPLAVGKIRRLRSCARVRDANVVEIGAAFLDRSASSSLGIDEAGTDEQFVDRWQQTFLDLVRRDLAIWSLEEGCSERPGWHLFKLPLAKQDTASRLGSLHLIGAVHEFGEFLGERPLRSSLVRFFLCRCYQGVDLVFALETECAQKDGDIAIVSIQPELEKGVRTGEFGV